MNIPWPKKFGSTHGTAAVTGKDSVLSKRSDKKADPWEGRKFRTLRYTLKI